MDPLERYRDLRLTLADTLRAQLHLARERRDAVMEQSVRALLTRLARDAFTVAVAGQFSRGKTTLLNALLGAEHLPTGALPLTSVLTRIGYASAAAATYLRRGSDAVIPVPVAEVPQLVARQSTRRSELQVTAVDIRLPAELLRLGVTFVDTPGIGGMDAATSAITLGFLPDADAVVFVTSADSALNDTDLALLDRFPATAHVFCVVNKRDLVTADEAREVAASVSEAVSSRRPAGTAEVFTLSALHGLRAEQSLAPQADDGGIAGFHARLTAFLTSTRMPVALAAVRDRAEPLAHRQRELLVLADRHAQASQPQRARTDGEVTHARTDAAVEQAAIVRGIRLRLDARMRALDYDPAWRLPQSLLLDASDAELDAALDARAGRVTEEAVRAASGDLARLAATTGAPMQAALEWAHGAGDGGSSAAGPDAAGRGDSGSAGLGPGDVPWDTASLLPVAPTRLTRTAPEPDARHWPGHDHRLAARREQQAARLAADDREQVTAHVEQWMHALEREVQRRTDDESARLDAYLAVPATAAQFEALDRIDAHLAEVAAALDAGAADLDDAAPAPTDGTTSDPGDAASPAGGAASAPDDPSTADHVERRCVVCARQRDTLVTDLAQRQFALATREAEQAALAGAHGLCPAHTWSYVTMTSPLGISAAYAPLAETAAEALRAADPATLRRRAADLAAGPRACAVCAGVDRAERAALDGLTADDTVCVRHLSRATDAGVDPELVEALARRLAETLARDAQDMRAYALKREAHARGLLTAEETRAHREALLLLAGDPALALPLVNEQERDELSFGS